MINETAVPGIYGSGFCLLGSGKGAVILVHWFLVLTRKMLKIAHTEIINVRIFYCSFQTGDI